MLRRPLIKRLDARDRDLYLRWVLTESTSAANLWAWTAITHAGGVTACIVLALAPLLTVEGPFRVVAVQAAWTLALTRLFVEVVKRQVVRDRPTVLVTAEAHVAIPDQFSFPSGHAACLMSLAVIHSAAFHSLALPMLALATLVGVSRVKLGAHYPGDVLVGQLIGIGTAALVLALW